MPILDHFHPPLYPIRSWVAFHSKWANCLSDYLNEILPRRYFAEAHLHLDTYPDDREVHIIDAEDEARLVAVIELVSPSNKDRPAERRAFAAKCAAYLERGVGLVIVDIVTNRHANLHNELIRLMELDLAFSMPAESRLYTVAYRPVQRNETSQADVWSHQLALGGPLPVVPLALRGAGAVPLDLNGTYQIACTRSRLV